MDPPNLFHDVCHEPSDLNEVLQVLRITSPFEDQFSEKLSIINFYCKDSYRNKILQQFFHYLTNYYEQGSETVFDVLKHQICQALIITNGDSFVGGALYVLSPAEGSFVFFLHIDKDLQSHGIGTLLLQIIQVGTRKKLKTNNMLIWVEVIQPVQGKDTTDISGYYKKLGFHLTNPTKHDIQHIVPPTVLSIINAEKTYSHIMRCTEPITKQGENKGAINAFTNKKCDMCQADLGCALVCDYNMKDSHNKLEGGKQVQSICGTSLCMTCQISFGMTVSNRCKIHHFAVYKKKTRKINDSQYKNYIQDFLIKSKEENKNDNNFWADPENSSKNFKYCRHCRIHNGNDFDKSSFEQLPLRIKENQSLDCILTHPTDMYFFNNIHELKLDQKAKCFHYGNNRHSNYLDSNLGSVKSILTNTIFGIKHVTGIGDCGFLCLMIGINSFKEIKNKFKVQVTTFYKNNSYQNPNRNKNIIPTESIEDFKEIFMQMHTLKITHPHSDTDKQNTEEYLINSDYEQTESIYNTYIEWKEAYENQKLTKREINTLYMKWRKKFVKSSIQNTADNYYLTNNDFVRFMEYFKIGIVIIKDYANPDQQFKDGKYFISDCNFYTMKGKHIFTYCEYFMIIGYFDNIHFDLFYNHITKKAIYSTKKSKERDFVRRLCDEQNLFYFFGKEKNESDYERGWNSFLKKHKQVSVVDKDNYVNNKWMDIADGVEIPEDKEYKHEAVFLVESNFDVTTCPPYIKATHKSSKNVTFYDITYYVIVDVPETKFITNTTDETTLMMKKYLWYHKLKQQIDNDGIHTNKYLYENTGFTWKTPATTISLFYKSQIHMVKTFEEKKMMWVKSQVVMNPIFRLYTDFHENTFKNNEIKQKFTIHFYDQNNLGENFQIYGINMEDFLIYIMKNTFIDIKSNATATIKELFGNDISLLTESVVYVIFQKIDNGEIHNISMNDFYDMMIICLDDSKQYSCIKAGFMKYLGLTSDDIDVFLKEVTIKNANKAGNMNIEKFHSELTIRKKVSHDNLDESSLSINFAAASVKVKEVLEELTPFKEIFSEKLRDYELIEDDWGNDFSSQWFDNKDLEIQIKTKHGIQYWEYSDLNNNHKSIHNMLNDHVVDHILKIWNHLFHKHSPSILCMSSIVPNLFMTGQTVSIKSTITSLYRLTEGMFFKGIDMFLCPICQGIHYYLVIINLAKNEGYVIDGLNRNTLEEDKERKLIYIQRALTLLHLCQKINIKGYNFNMPSKFNLQTFKLKECVIPPQKDGISCGVILMMAIYQIYIQGKHIKSFYNERNHKTFRKLLFNTLYGVTELLNKHKKSDKPDSITSEDIKSISSTTQSTATNKTIPEIISSANIEKKSEIMNLQHQPSNKDSIDSVPSNKGSIDSVLSASTNTTGPETTLVQDINASQYQQSNKDSIDSIQNKTSSETTSSQIVQDSNAPNIGSETTSLQIVQDSNATNIGLETTSLQIVQDSNAPNIRNSVPQQKPRDRTNPFESSSDDDSAFLCSSEDEEKSKTPKFAVINKNQETKEVEQPLKEKNRGRIKLSARKSTGGIAPPRPTVTKAGRATYEKELKNFGIERVPRLREQITQDYSLKENLDDTLNKLENEDNLDKIKEIKQETYDHFATKYKTLSQCKYILHTVQFKEGVELSTKTQMALKDKKKQQKFGNYKQYEDMIESHHYFVSTSNKAGKPENFNKTFFEFENNFTESFFKSVRSIINDKNYINKKTSGMDDDEMKKHMNELKKMYNHLSRNDSHHYVNKWTPIAELAKPIWKKKLEEDKNQIRNMYGIPIKLKYEDITKQPRGTNIKYRYKVWFTFLGMDEIGRMDENDDDYFGIKNDDLFVTDNSNSWYQYLDKDTLKEYGPEYENLILQAKKNPDKVINISHEATSKTDIELHDSNAPRNACYQGNKSKCLTYSLVAAITYLLRSGVIEDNNDIMRDNIVNKLKEIKQQEQNIVDRVNHIMSYKGMFECRKVNKKKRKRKTKTPPTDILCKTFERTKNCIYVCSLLTSAHDNSHTVSIVNDWIFDPNFTEAIEFGRDGLDKCCKYFDEYVNYKTCKNIWIYTPSKSIFSNNNWS